jgi:hypothetical protein
MTPLYIVIPGVALIVICAVLCVVIGWQKGVS